MNMRGLKQRLKLKCIPIDIIQHRLYLPKVFDFNKDFFKHRITVFESEQCNTSKISSDYYYCNPNDASRMQKVQFITDC